MEQLRSPARLRDDAAGLARPPGTEVADRGAARPGWTPSSWRSKPRRLRSRESRCPTSSTSPAASAFEPPRRRPDDEFAAAAATIERCFPATGRSTDRLAALGRRGSWSRRSPAGCRRLARRRFRVAVGGDVRRSRRRGSRVSLVSGQPWAAYNWYDGGRRSRIDINTDLPARAWDLVHTVAHETYPGHHLEHAWKEADLVDGAGRLEASMLLDQHAGVPHHEGLANVGLRFAAPPEERDDLLLELFERAGLAIAADPAASREAAERTLALAGARRELGGRSWERRDPPPCRRTVPRRGPRLPLRGRADDAGGRREAARVHRAPALADICLRLRRRRGDDRRVAGRGARRPSGPPVSAACSTRR